MDASSYKDSCEPTLKDMNAGSGSCYQWCPLLTDTSPSLTVHFHMAYHLTKVIIHTVDVNANYVLEHSMDGTNWVTASKENKTVGTNMVRKIIIINTAQNTSFIGLISIHHSNYSYQN